MSTAVTSPPFPTSSAPAATSPALSSAAPTSRALPQSASTSRSFSRTTLFWWLAGLIICMGWDRAVWLMVSTSGVAKLEWLERAGRPEALLAALTSIHSASDAAHLLLASCYSFIYYFGRIWIWLALAIVVLARSWVSPDVSRVRQALRHAVFIAIVPGAAGLGAELLKLITRRARPELSDGMYTFNAPSASPLDPAFWSTSGIGLASSHAAVAVAAALAAAAVFPRFRWPLLLLAGACTLSRIVVGAHYLSDAYIGASVAVLVFWLFYAWDRRNNPGVPITA